MDLLIRMAWADKKENVWQMVWTVATQWAAEDARSPLKPEDEVFFRDRVECEIEKAKQKVKDRRKRAKQAQESRSAKSDEVAAVCKPTHLANSGVMYASAY